MSHTIDGYQITATRTLYRRAGLDLREPVMISADALTEAQRSTLEADPVVHVEKVEIPADQVATEGEPLPPATNDTELMDQIQQVADTASLDKLAEGETRQNVLDAIQAQRENIDGGGDGDGPTNAPEKLPTRKADLQAWLKERGVAYNDADTVPKLTEKAEASQAQAVEGGE